MLWLTRVLAWTNLLALASGAWAAGPPSAQEQREFLAAARRKAAGYLSSLPDYICAEKSIRYRNGSRLDTLLVRLSHYQGQDRYDLIAIDGHATQKPYDSVQGLKSHGEYGGVLKSILGPNSPTAFRFQKWISIRNKRSAQYAFELPARDSDFQLFWDQASETSRIRAGLSGEIAFDRDTFETLRLTYRAVATGVAMLRSAITVDFDDVEIGGQRYLLPINASMQMITRPWDYTNEVTFSDYRKFSAESSVTFDEKPVKR